MSWRAGAVGLVAVLLVLSGASAPTLAEVADPRPGPGGGAVGPHGAAAAANHTPADPPADVLGWEAGYWHNESIAVNQSDGLNATELNVTVARTMARVEVIRGLEFQRAVPVEVISREEFSRRQSNRTFSTALNRFDNAKFEALFLVPETADSIPLQNQNRGANVLGQYNTRTDRMLVVSGEGTTLRMDEVTLAHELMHALQDQHFNLSRYRARTRDGANAENGLIEGDASLVDIRYRRACEVGGQWADTCLFPPGGPGSGTGDLAHIGIYLMNIQPYSTGTAFVASLYADGGWAAVTHAYDRVPPSTEQVIHPERYPRDEPAAVRLEDRHTDAWMRVRPPDRPDHAVMGEASVFVMLWYPGYDSSRRTEVVPYLALLNRSGGEISSFEPFLYDHPYSAGWDGDRLHVYVNDANETAYVWRLVWDTPADATEFVEGYRQVLGYRGGEEVEPGIWVIDEGGFADAFAVEIEGDTVTIVNAPSLDELSAVREGVRASTATAVTPASPTLTTSVVTLTPTGSLPVTVTPGQPGFGSLVALVALLFGLLARRLA